MRGRYLLNALVLALGVAFLLRASDPSRDFSGKWVLDENASEPGPLGQVENSLTVTQGPGVIRCSMGPMEWSYALDGSETRNQVGGESGSSVAKWEGAALLINTQVSGAQNYTVMDRWELSRSRNTFTIARQVVRASGNSEGTLVYRREGSPVDAARRAVPGDAPPQAGWRQTGQSSDGEPVLARRPEPGTPADITIPTGTRVLLSLTAEVNTKYAQEGDRVYLRTASPVAMNGRMVIPRGSDVQGTITRTKPAGKVVGKGELFIRFDSLVLPNGVSRDFRARPPGEEGKVEGGGKSADPRAVMAGAGMGATIGAITRGLPGAGVGGAAGALAGVLLSRNQNVVLRPGTHLEMILDRDLVFHPEELP
jgi:type IV secretion system protein VirB10